MKNILSLLAAALGLASSAFAAQYDAWKRAGSLTILTAPEGANLPASAAVEQFPVLLLLHRDWFDFTRAKARGEDVRFSTGAGEALAFEVRKWDAAGGTASISVRVTLIKGNERFFYMVGLRFDCHLEHTIRAFAKELVGMGGFHPTKTGA